MWWRKWFIVASVGFSVLGTAGLVTTRVEALPEEWRTGAFVGALVSLIFVIGSELYRAFGVEQTALRLLAAQEAYSLLEVTTEEALQDSSNPLPRLQRVRTQLRSLNKMFHQVLPPAGKTEVEELVTNWLDEHRPEGGWRLTASQQRPKQKPG